MKTKQIVGLVMCCVFAFVATDTSAATEKTKLILPDGKPAARAIVFSVSQKDRPLLMVNWSAKFLPAPMGADGKPIHAAGDQNSTADDDGLIRIDREGQAHLVVAQSGEAMAFVPMGTTGDVTLRECGRLKMDYSAIQKKVVEKATRRRQARRASGEFIMEDLNAERELRAALGDTVFLANWKNSLAGTYAIVESEPDEYRLHDWFDIQFLFVDHFWEVAVPPGEVSVGLLHADQIEKMSRFRFEITGVHETFHMLTNRTLRGICVTSGIHSITSGKVTTAPAVLGCLAQGKLRMHQRFPKWEGVKIFEGAQMSGSTTGVSYQPSIEDMKNPDSYVGFLLSPPGKALRIRNVNRTVWLNNDGTFLTPPYAIGDYQFLFTPSQANQLETDRDQGFNRGFFVEHTKGKPIVFEVADQPIPEKSIVYFGDVSFSFEGKSEITSLDPKQIISAVSQLENERQRLLSQYGPGHPQVKRIEERIRKMKSRPVRMKDDRAEKKSEMSEGHANAKNQLAGSETENIGAKARLTTQSSSSEKSAERPESHQRELVAAIVKVEIADRRRKLLELEERIKAARERLRKREENIEAIIDRELSELNKAAKSEK